MFINIYIYNCEYYISIVIYNCLEEGRKIKERERKKLFGENKKKVKSRGLS